MDTAAREVAAELRWRLPGVGVKKLHKLLYYCQGHHLAAFGTPVFAEPISAWDMGPVVGELWFAEKQSGRVDVPGLPVLTDERVLNTIGYVVSRYGRLSGDDLERLTHGEDPWRDADLTREPHGRARISVEAMTRYFRQPAPDAHDGGPTVDDDALHRWLSAAAHRPARPAAPDTPDEVRARASHRAE